MGLSKLIIDDLEIEKPIVQGGMGVGISLASLAGAVAHEGAVGIISSAQIGFREEDFDKDPLGANVRAISKELKKARDIAGTCLGAIGFNIMVATKGYEDYVREAVRSGADIIISGAGLALDLPRLVDEGMSLRKDDDDVHGLRKLSRTNKTKFAPIVSSAKSATVILRMWDRKQQTTADAVVIEGPLAGGHLGFSLEDLNRYGADTNQVSKTYDAAAYDKEIIAIIEVVKEYEKKYNKKIPVIVAGGIYTHEDVLHAIELGAAGVQVGTRFVTTEECDAPEEYKQSYIDAKEEDIQITKSPVGLPGRAISNSFLKRVKERKEALNGCHLCLNHCDRDKIPYCITDALISAAEGRVDDALLFCGANAYRANKIETVKDVIESLYN